MEQYKNRTCLKCGSTFPSTGPANRLCHDCKNKNRKVTNRVPNGGSSRKMKPSGDA